MSYYDSYSKLKIQFDEFKSTDMYSWCLLHNSINRTVIL